MSHQAISKSLPVKLAERTLFNIKWLLLPFYFGLAVVLFLYGWAYFNVLVESFHAPGNDIDHMKLVVLDLIDAAMVANLIKMIVTGSYNSFISKEHGYKGENISSGMLKIKIATSVVVIMMIHLLKDFMHYEVNFDALEKDLAIFGAISVVTMILGLLEYIHIKGEQIEHSQQH